MDYESRGCPDLSYHSDRAWYAQMENTSRQIGMMYNRIYEDPGQERDDLCGLQYALEQSCICAAQAGGRHVLV